MRHKRKLSLAERRFAYPDAGQNLLCSPNVSVNFADDPRRYIGVS
jgi:hypothetical protein